MITGTPKTIPRITLAEFTSTGQSASLPALSGVIAG
jgi:hypothetical protein